VKPLIESVIHPVAVTHPGDCRHFAQGHSNLRAGRERMRCSNSHAVLGNVQNAAKHSLGAVGTSRIDCSQALRWEARTSSDWTGQSASSAPVVGFVRISAMSSIGKIVLTY
jgi:hypothetical protein